MSVLRRPMAFAATAAAVVATAGVLTAPSADAAPNITWVQCSHNGSSAVLSVRLPSHESVHHHVVRGRCPPAGVQQRTGAVGPCPGFGSGSVWFRVVVTDPTGQDIEDRWVNCASIPDPL